MGKALYRKYRSKSFDEVVGQPHITSTLKNAVKNDQISHAYLFTGPRGVGKTSIARILAHDVNGLTYDEESSTKHIDIIEIDAASNRRIDEIRDLRDKVHIAPTSSKYKVYIIDEAHMLTKEAFNALLKTLEEPPSHAIFILATTEAHKLPETIISRTQRFTFKPVSKSDVVGRLKYIAKNEKIDINEGALELVAEHGRGSFRDSISILDQLSNTKGQIDEDSVLNSLGVAQAKNVDVILHTIADGDTTELLSALKSSSDQGVEPQLLASAISKQLRNGIFDKDPIIDVQSSLELIKELIEVPRFSNPEVALEVALLGTAFKNADQPAVRRKPAKKPEKISDDKIVEPDKQKAEETKENIEPVKKKQIKVDSATQIWKEVLTLLRGKHNTLYGIARMAEPKIEDDKLNLSFAFDFHRRRCSEKMNQQIISNIIKDISGKRLELSFTTNKKSQPVQLDTKKEEPSDTLDSITDIFGGGEVLDS